MKFLHTGDLHIGKTVNDFSMLEDQRYILKQIEEIAEREKTDAVIIAGDIYDRAIPSADAVVLLNDFLTDMAAAEIPVLMISGNHDSPERIGFADAILEKKGIHIAGMYRKTLKHVTLEDAYGKVTFVLMPFVKPAVAEGGSSSEAVENMLQEDREKDKGRKKRSGTKERRVLITHFFVTDNGKEPELSDGETTIHVGGLDNVESSLFSSFDYTALGHIHRAQKVGDKAVYYAGAPLAYSFSEAGRVKTVNLVELGENGEVSVQKIPLTPLHEMRKIRGRIEELMQPEVVAAADRNDYIQAELAGEEELIDPIGMLRTVYPNVMQIVLLKNEKKENADYISRIEERRKNIPDLFKGFYEMIRGVAPDEERMQIIEETAREAEGEELQ